MLLCSQKNKGVVWEQREDIVNLRNRLCSPVWHPLATSGIQMKTLNIINVGFSLAQVTLQDKKQKPPRVKTRPFS